VGGGAEELNLFSEREGEGKIYGMGGLDRGVPSPLETKKERKKERARRGFCKKSFKFGLFVVVK